MPSQKESLKDRFSRYRQIKLSVAGRKSGKSITNPVWFVAEGDTLYLLPVHGSDTQWYQNLLRNPKIHSLQTAVFPQAWSSRLHKAKVNVARATTTTREALNMRLSFLNYSLAIFAYSCSFRKRGTLYCYLVVSRVWHLEMCAGKPAFGGRSMVLMRAAFEETRAVLARWGVGEPYLEFQSMAEPLSTQPAGMSRFLLSLPTAPLVAYLRGKAPPQGRCLSLQKLEGRAPIQELPASGTRRICVGRRMGMRLRIFTPWAANGICTCSRYPAGRPVDPLRCRTVVDYELCLAARWQENRYHARPL